MIPIEVRRALLDPNEVTSVTPIAPGLSGATLYRCESHLPLALKRWPSPTSRRRVESIHSVLRPLARSCEWIPELKTYGPANESVFVDTQHQIWELASWMPGAPLQYDAPIDLIRAGGKALAAVHQHLRPFGIWSGPATAVSERIERLGVLDRTLPGCWQTDVTGLVHPSVAGKLQEATVLLRADWAAASAQSLAELSRLAMSFYPLQYVLRDIHRDHLLFDGDSPSGFIDFDAMRIDTPAVDLARWITSFSAYARNPLDLVDMTLAGYREVSTLNSRKPNDSASTVPATFSPDGGGVGDALESDFRTLIIELSRSSLWISLANWVVWLVVERKRFPNHGLVQQRIGRLVDTVRQMRQR